MLEALRFVLGAVASKDIVPALTHVHVEDGLIQAFDGRVCMQAPVPSLAGLTFTVPSDRFLRAIEACKNAPTISVKERVTITQGKFRAVLSNREGFPRQEMPQPTGEAIPGLLATLKRLRPFVSDDASRSWSLGILLAEDGHAYATNNVSIARAVMPSVGFSVVLPVYAIDELLRVGEEPLAVSCVDNAVLFFFSGERVLKAQVLTGEWPDVAALFASGAKETGPVPEDLYDTCDTLSRLVPDYKLPVLRMTQEGVSTDEGEHSAAMDTPPGILGRYDWRTLKLVLAAANEWGEEGSRGYFIGDGIEGIFVGMVGNG